MEGSDLWLPFVTAAIEDVMTTRETPTAAAVCRTAIDISLAAATKLQTVRTGA